MRVQRSLVLLLPILLSMHAFAAEKQKAPKTSQEILKLVGGRDAINIMQNADSIRAYRLPPKSYFKKSLEQYKILSGPVKVENSLASKHVSLLLNKESYLWNVGKGCFPDYGIRIEFQKGEETVDVLYCFGCSQLATYRNGKHQSGGLFDPVAKKFGSQMKKIFPEDKIVQSLEE